MPAPIPLIQEQIYHIYNRGNNRESIFLDDRNYDHFLRLYKKYISPIADTFAYCLLPNHFHLLVQIKSAEVIFQNHCPFRPLPDKNELIKITRKIASQGFSNLFNAYTKAFNKAYQRTGSLLEKPFHRKLVADDLYFQQLVLYINFNSKKHGIVNDFRQWRYSSFDGLVIDCATRLDRATVMEYFGGVDTFLARQEEYQPGSMEEEF